MNILKNIYHPIVLSCTLALTACKTYYPQGAGKDWPVKEWTTNSYGICYNNALVVNGFVLLKNNDTIKGKMKILPYSPPVFNYIPVLPNGKESAKDILSIERKNIRYVRYKDSVSGNLTDMVNIEDKDLWRLIAGKNNVCVYDDVLPGDTSALGEEMILVVKNRKVKIYGNSIFHTDGNTPLILRFINRRYKVQLTAGDFKDDRDMIDYILNREAANPG